TPTIETNQSAFEEAEKNVQLTIEKILSIKGNQTVESLHKKLGKIMWDHCGMSRNEIGLKQARKMVQDLRKEFWSDVYVPGQANEFNPELEKAIRVADFIDLGELMIVDALNRNESCGGHFREEYQTEEGETLRDDDHYAFVAAWQWTDVNQEPTLIKEALNYQEVKIASRSYK
ncbi:MAG: fumarate reductase/succinate dehydrogenase flavoprotein subunit, partial [Saprospiraceae bacterium]